MNCATLPAFRQVMEFIHRLTSQVSWENFTLEEIQFLMKNRIKELGRDVEKLFHLELQLNNAPDFGKGLDILLQILPTELIRAIQNPAQKELLLGYARGTHEIRSKNLLKIDRSKPFDPIAFLGGGECKIAEQDERSLALSEIDLTAIHFKAMLEGSETSIEGERKLERLKKAGHIRLDAKVFQTLWENRHLIPQCWKEKTNYQTTYIFFDGTVLRNSSGYRFVLYLYWGGAAWHRGLHRLDRGWYVYDPSAVLPKAA